MDKHARIIAVDQLSETVVWSDDVLNPAFLYRQSHVFGITHEIACDFALARADAVVSHPARLVYHDENYGHNLIELQIYSVMEGKYMMFGCWTTLLDAARSIRQRWGVDYETITMLHPQHAH